MGGSWGRLLDSLRWPREVEAHAPLARALWDQHRTGVSRRVEIHRAEGFTYEIDTEAFFSLEGEQARIDARALSLCEGRVLDVGAGAGRHSLALQANGHDVVAIDVSPICARLLAARGVRQVQCIDVMDLEAESFDTILFAMQTVGIVGTVVGLERLLDQMRDHVRPGGQILLDSSPPVEVPETMIDGQALEVPGGARAEREGEVEVAFSYRNWRGRPFGWLYISSAALIGVALRKGWACEVVDQLSDNGEYLARLTPA